ncbi:MAG: hypothetical protein NC421_00495 [Lachnospiraceae bacterium]|nr:hypothetical protein [Lachnospiraceae bacterium]
MKFKFNIAIFAALAISLAACSDDEFTGTPQVTPAEPTMPADGITGADAVANGASVNLNDGSPRVINITDLKDFPSGSELQVVMKVAKDQSMTGAKNVVLETIPGVDGAIYSCNAPAVAFNDTIKSLFGKNPSPKTVFVNYTAYAVDGTSSVILGAIGAAQSFVVTPFALDYVVEDEYYLVNTLNNTTIKFNHSDKDVYDDPSFSVIFTVEQDGFAWKIAPKSALNSLGDASKLYGNAEADAAVLEGALALGAQAGNVEEVGPYQFVINMETLEFSYKQAYEALYVIGNGQSWNGGNAAQMTTKDYVKYGAFVPVDGGFKILTTPGWTKPEIGGCSFALDPKDNLYKAEAVMSMTGTSDMSGLDKGVWAIVFDMNTKKLTASSVTSLEFIGDATGGWNDDQVQPLQPASTDGVATIWTGNITFSGSGEYKVRANHGWAYSLGGAADQLIWDAGNIKSPAAGTYKVTLNLNDPVVHLQLDPLN